MSISNYDNKYLLVEGCFSEKLIQVRGCICMRDEYGKEVLFFHKSQYDEICDILYSTKKLDILLLEEVVSELRASLKKIGAEQREEIKLLREEIKSIKKKITQ